MEGTTPSMPSTPPQRTNTPSTSCVHDTPVCGRATDSVVYQTGTLRERRQLVATTLGDIREYCNTNWWAQVLPKWPKDAPNDLAESIYAKLVQKGEYVEEEQRWKSFPVDPARDQRPETAVHRDWKLVVDQIVQALHCVYRPQVDALEYWQQPSLAPESQVQNLTRPDSYMIRLAKMLAKMATAEPDVPDDGSKTGETEASSLGVMKKLQNPKHSWKDICEVGEFKKVDSTSQNGDTAVEQVIWSIHHMLREDSARRFVYGSTFIGREFRSFLGSRIGVFASQAVDVHHDPKSIIQYYVRMMCADDISLGWDASMTRNEEGQIVFSLETGNKAPPLVLTATRELFSQAAENIRGRATRVFEVTRDSEGSVFALKIGWIEEGRLTEGQIIKNMKESLRKVDPNDQTLEQHVLDIEAEGVVTFPDVGEDTTRLPLGNMDINGDKCAVMHLPITASMQQIISLSSHPGSIGGFEEKMTGVPLRSVSKVHREHRWTLYKAVLKPIWQLDDLRDMCCGLTDVGRALSAVAKAGYVHRDPSAGNGYWDERKKRGYLSDFEYAVPWEGERAGHGVRTGTPMFMPLEVAKGAWEFPTPIRVSAISRGAAQVPEFLATPLHDLESWAWVWLWAVVRFQPVGAAGPTECQRILSSFLFNGNPANSSRGTYIRWRACMAGKKLWSLQDEGGSPLAFSVVADLANTLFKVVHAEHHEYQKLWTPDVFAEAWESALNLCIETTLPGNIPIKPWSDNPMLGGLVHRTDRAGSQHKRNASQSVSRETAKRSKGE
ncbi:hypothetical protein DACRYDRAFT_23623 [Dacryopinax primogenitus]|uniref:Fungal-type protein kinase domain-containing protein n=1 Tax=Dacryopinax primogenitus (strain DJM 731) TaxID=1858805 RepID=M5FTP4_DACPD|nr:uncharacterized protein DACRYDRAFT_23623 [Dacryopinax primogenitus]EJT99478.1 hypothetical protein DACRYDRAFT_23623 [Dacryopinax primogenitus]